MTPGRIVPPPHPAPPPKRFLTGYFVVLTIIWTLVWLVASIALGLFLGFAAVGTSIGADDGANRIPRLLLSLFPYASAIVLAAGLWFLHRLCNGKGANFTE